MFHNLPPALVLTQNFSRCSEGEIVVEQVPNVFLPPLPLPLLRYLGFSSASKSLWSFLRPAPVFKRGQGCARSFAARKGRCKSAEQRKSDTVEGFR